MDLDLLAYRLLKGEPDYIADARAGVHVGNSVAGSVLSLTTGSPRWATERAVAMALHRLDAKRDIPVRVVLRMPPLDVALLNATTKHTGKTREQVVADALRVPIRGATEAGRLSPDRTAETGRMPGLRAPRALRMARTRRNR